MGQSLQIVAHRKSHHVRCFPESDAKSELNLDQRTAGHGSHLGQISDRPAMTLGSPLVRFAASPLPPPSGQGRKRMQGFSESRAAPYPA